MLHLISMNIFEGHLGIKWSIENNLMMSSVMWFGSHIILKKKKNLQKSSFLKWLNRLRRNFTRMTTYPWGTKFSYIWRHMSHVWQPYWRNMLNNVFSETTYLIDVKLQNYDRIVMGNTCFKFQLHRTHGLAAIII